MKILLENGADIRTENNDGDTALHLAAKNGCDAAMRLLLKIGADFEAKNVRVPRDSSPPTKRALFSHKFRTQNIVFISWIPYQKTS